MPARSRNDRPLEELISSTATWVAEQVSSVVHTISSDVESSATLRMTPRAVVELEEKATKRALSHSARLVNRHLFGRLHLVPITTELLFVACRNRQQHVRGNKSRFVGRISSMSFDQVISWRGLHHINVVSESNEEVKEPQKPWSIPVPMR